MEEKKKVLNASDKEKKTLLMHVSECDHDSGKEELEPRWHVVIILFYFFSCIIITISLSATYEKYGRTLQLFHLGIRKQ